MSRCVYCIFGNADITPRCGHALCNKCLWRAWRWAETESEALCPCCGERIRLSQTGLALMHRRNRDLATALHEQDIATAREEPPRSRSPHPRNSSGWPVRAGPGPPPSAEHVPAARASSSADGMHPQPPQRQLPGDADFVAVWKKDVVDSHGGFAQPQLIGNNVRDYQDHLDIWCQIDRFASCLGGETEDECVRRVVHKHPPPPGSAVTLKRGTIVEGLLTEGDRGKKGNMASRWWVQGCRHVQ